MTAYRYEAVDAAGRRRRGTITADTPRRARKEIQNAGLTPLAIKSVRERTIARGASTRRPSAKDTILATRQLATLIDASTTVEEALMAVSAQSRGAPISEILLTVRGRIIEGWKLSDALAEHPRTFSPLYRGIVAAGEASGNLGPVMLRLADMVEKNRSMLMKAVTSLIYPAVIFIVAIFVVWALMNFVVPKIASEITTAGQQLPWLTRSVIGASDFVRAWGWAVLVGLIGLIAGAVLAYRRPDLRRKIDGSVLKIPLIGGLARELDAARFARTLATLFASGTPLLDSLRAARRTVTNAYIDHRLETTLTGVREGTSLSQSIRRADVFPPMLASMIAAGERSGTLPALLEKSAVQMEQGFENAVTVALRLLEPMVIVILGVIVMVIVLAIMLPILQVNALVL